MFPLLYVKEAEERRKKNRKEKKREREKRVDRGIRLTMKRGARRCDCVRVCDWKWANF